MKYAAKLKRVGVYIRTRLAEVAQFHVIAGAAAVHPQPVHVAWARQAQSSGSIDTQLPVVDDLMPSRAV